MQRKVYIVKVLYSINIELIGKRMYYVSNFISYCRFDEMNLLDRVNAPLVVCNINTIKRLAVNLEFFQILTNSPAIVM